MLNSDSGIYPHVEWEIHADILYEMSLNVQDCPGPISVVRLVDCGRPPTARESASAATHCACSRPINARSNVRY